jgi:hypothetical protein
VLSDLVNITTRNLYRVRQANYLFASAMAMCKKVVSLPHPVLCRRRVFIKEYPYSKYNVAEYPVFL